MRMLLLGADGQVGFELQRTLAPLGQVVPTTMNGRLADGRACGRSDFSDPGALASLLESTRPDWIANAAAYTAVDRAEDEPERATRVNAGAVAEIAEYAARHGASVLHFSTDYVFPGDGSEPYREDAATGPISVYGSSKLAGEEALRASGCKHVTLRTAWVYGARGHNFLLTMLKLARTRDRLTVVDDQSGTPTPARLLAQIAALAIARIGDGERPEARALLGTWHATAAGSTTWCGFAREIVARAVDAGVLERAPRVDPIASGDYPTKAARPSYSVLDCSRLERAFSLRLPDWREGLATVIGELAEARRDV